MEITPKFYQMWLTIDGCKPSGFTLCDGEIIQNNDLTSGVFIGPTSYEASEDIAFSRHIVKTMEQIKKTLEKTLPREYEIHWARANTSKTPFSVNLNDIRKYKADKENYQEGKILEVSIFRFEKKEV